MIAGPEASAVTFARMARYPEPGWNVPRRIEHSPDGTLVTFLASEKGNETMSLFALDVKAGTTRVMLRESDLAGLAGDPAATGSRAFSHEEELRRERQRDRNEGVTAYTWAAHAPVLVVPHGGDVFVRDGRPGKNGALRALTMTPEDELDAKPCATGERVAFVRKGELVVVDTATGKELFTTKGAADGLTHGLSDFNGQEELDEPSGYFWSPRCDRIVYLEVDERPVSTVPVLGYRGGAPELMMQRYPRAGQKNPIVRAGVVDLGAKKTTWLKMPDAAEHYLGRFTWKDDGSALFMQTLTRDQKNLALLRVDPRTGTTTELARESSPAWVSFSPMRLLEKTDELLFTSTRAGHTYLELRSATSGAVGKTLTEGAWDVESIAAVDEAGHRALVTGTRDGPLERHLYAVPLAAGGADEPPRITRLTSERGVHEVHFDESGKLWIDVHSAADRPPRAVVMDEHDAQVAELPAHADADLASLGIRAPKLVTVESSTGETLHGALLAPVAATGKHPVIVMVYGGPGAQMVLDRWSPRLLWQHLADRGFVVFQLDNRGSSGRGPAFAQTVHKRLGRLELEDQLAGAKYLATLPFVDASRIGIYGHSYGGFMASLAMLEGGGVFKAGAAGAPVTDWRLYDTAYTERYMETPAQNPEGYAAADLSKKAASLTGRLLLVHAQMDENVHYENTAQLVDALVTAGKHFDLLVLPGERHGQRVATTRAYVTQRVTEFFAENL